MSRPRSAGLKPIRKRMWDESVRIYYYNRRIGRALGTDLDAALARANKTSSNADLMPGTMAALIVDYKAPPRWTTSFRNECDYNQYLDLIRNLFGNLRVKDLQPKHVSWIQKR